MMECSLVCAIVCVRAFECVRVCVCVPVFDFVFDFSTNAESVNNSLIKPIEVHDQYDEVEEMQQYALQLKTESTHVTIMSSYYGDRQARCIIMTDYFYYRYRISCKICINSTHLVDKMLLQSV